MRKNNLKNKTSAERFHFKRRVYERYGLMLNRIDIRNITIMIHKGEGEFIEQQSCRRTVWKLTYKDKEMIVVYDKNRHTPITCLHEGMLKEAII